MRNLLFFVGLLLPIISCGVYMRSILRGVTKPQRTTRFLLMVITGLSFLALLQAQDSSGLWLALVSLVESIIIFGLSIARGMGGRDKLDLACLIACGLGAIAWLGTGEAWVGLTAAIVVDFVAVVPALVKTWRQPHTESWPFYALGGLAGGCILLAGPWNVPSAAYPAYILVINGLFVWAILRDRGRLRSVAGEIEA